jgi:AcrR family transcriptional regulator
MAGEYTRDNAHVATTICRVAAATIGGADHYQVSTCAEEVYGEHGYEGTTIRAIAKKARANLGTLKHYWGSKRELFRDVFESRFKLLQQENLRRLREIEAQHAEGSIPDVKEVLRALLETTFFAGSGPTSEPTSGVEQSEARRRFQTLYGRALMDPSPEVVADINRIFERPVKLFLSLMRRACPELSAAELDWRVNCILGAQVFSLVYRERVGIFFGAEADVDSTRAAKWMLHFLMNGIDAPPFGDESHPSIATGSFTKKPKAAALNSARTGSRTARRSGRQG